MTPEPDATPHRLDVVDAGVELRADPSRVLAKLHVPGDGIARTRSRAADIVERVLAQPAGELARTARALLQEFGPRHHDFAGLLRHHAASVAFRSLDDEQPDLTSDEALVLGAVFTMEYAVEGAALCNPSVVPHPDQSGLAPGELRLAVAVRAIGEGHISTIGFASAVVRSGSGTGSRSGAGSGTAAAAWRFEDRRLPLRPPTAVEGEWTRSHLRKALEREGRLNELAVGILRSLPPRFRSGRIEEAIRGLPVEIAQRPEMRGDIDVIRTLAWSAYGAEFDEDSALSQRVLSPFAAEESHGMEDARFVLLDTGDGTFEYRATYTAYDGRTIAPRLIVSPDLRRFRIHRLAGDGATGKGMALFPRRIGGRMLALTRGDGENLSLSRSDDGLVWKGSQLLHAPHALWEAVQTGNCGSPIETDRGWLVPIHGVGPMRVYSIGMMLLDLEDPSRVIGRLARPLLDPAGALREGYVPNVVYSCGALVHDGVLWIPFGVGDARIRVASVGLDALLDAMLPVPA